MLLNKRKERKKPVVGHENARVRGNVDALRYVCPRGDKEPVQAKYKLRYDYLSNTSQFPPMTAGYKALLLSEPPKKGNFEGKRHILAGTSVSGTSQSIVNNLSICSRAPVTRSCTLLLEKRRWGRENKSAYPVVLEPCCVRIPAHLGSPSAWHSVTRSSVSQAIKNWR